MAASDSVHTAPPPTGNILPHSQRSRLLKSSRKIEAMLGTTPLVVPVVDLPPQISPSRATPRVERSKSKSGKGPQPVPQPVLLRSRSVALPSLMSSTHVKSSSIDTPGTSSGPSTPISALFSPITKETNDREREMRRKKMAKITRTLGENIPPELVFGTSYQQENKTSTTPKSAHRPGRLSVSLTSRPNVIIDTFPDPEGELTPIATTTTSSGYDSRVPFPTSQSAPAATPTASTFYQHAKAQSHYTLPSSSTTLHRSRSQRTIAGSYPVYHAGPFISSTPAFNTLEPSPSPYSSTYSLSASLEEKEEEEEEYHSPLLRAKEYASPPQRAQEYGGIPLHRAASTGATARPPPSPRNAKSLDVQRSSTFANFQDFDPSQERSPVEYVWGTRRQKGVYVEVDVDSEAAAAAAAAAQRKEKEWSGEWNVKDMGDVVKKLRQLKGR